VVGAERGAMRVPRFIVGDALEGEAFSEFVVCTEPYIVIEVTDNDFLASRGYASAEHDDGYLVAITPVEPAVWSAVLPDLFEYLAAYDEIADETGTYDIEDVL
jgi:hypothetical protein